MLSSRKERKIAELHGDFIEHGQPVMGVFKTEGEEDLLREQGFDPRSASFQFDITPGPWAMVTRPIKNDGWVRSTIRTFHCRSILKSSQRQFEREYLCFKHPAFRRFSNLLSSFLLGQFCKCSFHYQVS